MQTTALMCETMEGSTLEHASIVNVDPVVGAAGGDVNTIGAQGKGVDICVLAVWRAGEGFQLDFLHGSALSGVPEVVLSKEV